MTGLTPAGELLLSRLQGLIADDSDWRKSWTAHGTVAEWTRMATVTHARTHFPVGREYIQFVQVSLQGGKPYARIGRAPDTSPEGTFVTFKVANALLDDPVAALEEKKL